MCLWLYSIGNTLKVYILERHTDTPTITDMERLLYRYLVRRTSGAEDREVYAWLEASEKNRSLFFEVAAVWSAHRTLISPATGERCDAMLRRLNARIDADDAMQRPARFAWRRWMSAAAAAAVVVIAVAAAWLAGLRLPEAGRFQSYANHTGDVAVLHLEDGTQVWLQDGTELRYAVGKGDGERIVRLDGEAVNLTPKEYDILRFLMQNPGKVFSPSEIYRRVWDDLPLNADNALAVHIRHIREKIEYNPAEPRYLKVVWGKSEAKRS